MAASLHPQIQAAILRGAVVLTLNQRAARTLRHAFEAQQSAAGEILWTAPPIFAFDTWLGTLWHTLVLEGQDSRVLLNRSQEQTLWREIIAAEHAGQQRLPGTLAELAARAWRLLHLHNGAQRLQQFPTGTDARAFTRWSRAFARRLAQAAFLTVVELPAALTQACTEGTLDLPNAGLAIVDGDILSPAHEDMFAHFEQAGYPVERIQTAIPHPRTQLYSAADDPAELRAAATWARDLLALDPQARIAIVTADQQAHRPELERIFTAVLEPQSQSILTASAPPYEFSLGLPLARTALVDSAFHLLRWTLDPLPLTVISRLLVSPCMGAARGGTAPETLAAARFDSDVLGSLKTLRPELTLDACLDLLSRATQHHPALGELHSHLQALAHTAADLPPAQTHAAWADSFRAALEAAGWTRAATTDSLAFQTHRRWESLLDEFSALDLLGTHLTAAEALETLQELAEQAIFAPESRDLSPEAKVVPVQILGPLELGGAPFDALWLLAADDLAWPPTPSTSPLLAFALQRTLHMPGADPAGDQAAAQALTQSILTAAPQVVVSFALRHEEGERRLSPLIAAANPQTLLLNLESQAEALSFIAIEDTTPLPPTPDRIHQGGSSILQLQAACGFRAFAEKRLGSTAPPSSGQPREPGLDPRDRGEIVHHVMERFWRQVQTQQALRSLSTQARDLALDAAIDAALSSAGRLSQTSWDDAYLSIQRQRLRDLLRPWLDLELTRPEFTVRDAETELVTNIGPLRLKLRVDRIDETAAGRLILDYKTGAAAPSQWLSERPEAPQLPLYAALLAQQNEAPAGVAFALLRPGETLCLKGFATEAGVLEKPARLPAVSFDDQVEDWRHILTDLAEHFVQGDAAVQPKTYPGTCAYCTQRILCRLDPDTLDPALSQEAGEDEGSPNA